MKTPLKEFLKPVLARIPRLNNTFSLGIELGQKRLNLAQMEQVAGKTRIRAMASIPHPFSVDELRQDPKRLKDALKQAFAMQPFKGKRVVSCLSPDQIKILTISFRPVDGQPDSVPIIGELRERLKGELDGMVVDYMTVRQDEPESGKRDALVALASRQKIVAHLDLLESAGLHVDALDIGPAALARLISHIGALDTPDFPKGPNVLLVNFGADSSYLTVIWGRRLMLDRAVDFSENRLFSRLNLALEMPEELSMKLLYGETPVIQTPSGTDSDGPRQMIAEVLRPDINQLLLEINKTLVYMASKTRGKSVDKVYLAGRLCNYPGIQKYLSEQLQVPVKKLDPVAVFGVGAQRLADGLGTTAGMALTAGLALRGVPEHA